MSAKLRLNAAPATLVSIALVLALAMVGIVILGGGQAAAVQQVSCGDTITSDVTLHHNLTNCPNNGIIIGADNITLDLNYHTIDGDGTPAPGCDPNTEFCDFGVVTDGHDDGVTVLHGSVRDFAFGLALGPTRHSRVLGVSAARNEFFGTFFFRCDRCLLRNSAGSRTEGSGPDQVGMFLFQSHHDRILHSTFRRNAPAGRPGEGGGIASVKSTDAVIRGNRISRNGEAGIIIEKSDGLRISHNRLVRNDDGIVPGPGSHNVITRNHIFGGGDGIRIEKGHGNLVAHNVVAHTHRDGIRLGVTFGNGSFGGAHNTVRRNLVTDSRKYGFLVGKKDRHSRLKGNVAKRSKDDGFRIKSRSAKLTANRAVRNGDLGIEAVPGVIDGGGNEASGNGDLRQCINIVCG
jgi:parallel beta-helix repeat protein